MKKRLFSCLVFTIFLSISFDGYSQSEKAEAGIRAMMEQTKVVGLSVAVVKNNKIIYTNVFGKKNLESNTPLTSDCLFRIASISKSFSATSILQLVEAGKLSLEDDISNLVGFTVRNPKFPQTVITLRMVLSHRSSINDSQGYFTLDAINPNKNSNWAKCFNDYEPGKGYMYCNLNFNMVGTIIEKISGERFDQYVKHHVLDPLGLYGGYCVDSLDQSRFATIYEYNGDSARFEASPGAYAPRSKEIANYTMGYTTPIFSPTGGMKISAGDLAKYMIMHSKQGRYKGKRIIKKKSAAEMQTPLSSEEGYGLAIMTSEKLIPGKTMKGHTGSAYGLYSAMFFEPKEKFGFVVISNGCDPRYSEGFNTVIRQTVNILYESFIAK
ncbi:MAG TPA: serine hydrolase domain-containing protein [Sediminibacterium sp.]|nr:serine hydrolase domain-containing protein [Sediminibacterium sp.]